MKRDIKYIIKRIIIGVGIAVILGILKTNNVFADSLENAYINLASYSQTTYVSSSPWGNGATNLGYFDFNNYRINLSTSNSPDTFYLLFKDNSNYYIISSYGDWNPYGATPTFDSINIKSSGKFDLLYNGEVVYSDINLAFFIPGIISSSDLTNNSIINYLNNNYLHYNPESGIYNNNLYYQKINFKNSVSLTDKYDIIDYFNENLEFVSSSVPIYLNGVEIFPNYFQEINLENNQAVFFVPKDYTLVDTELVSSIEFVKFPFYYKGSINKGYFNINDNSQIVFDPPDSTIGGSETDFTYVDTSFPMHYSETGTTSNDLCAYIIYNTGTNTKIRFNSNEFDYYLVQDLHNYSQEITFIDDNNNQVTKTIQFNKTLQEMWEEGLNNDNDYWLSGFLNGGFTDNISGYFDLLKLPFNFLRSLSRDKCSSISLPIPFVNGNLSLNCLSSVFKDVLGNNFYNVIFYLISGLYAYRITIMNIDSLTDVLNPADDKIEVVDL